MQLLPWIAVGGALGAVARFAIGLAATAALGPRYPWGTLVVNVLGSFLLGGLIAWGDRGGLGPGPRALLTTGVMGALTTFSTFSVESVRLAERGEVAAAGMNVLGNVGLALTAATVGMVLVRRVLDSGG